MGFGVSKGCLEGEAPYKGKCERMRTIQNGITNSKNKGQMDLVGITYSDVRMRDRVVISKQMNELVDLIGDWYSDLDGMLATREGRQEAEHIMETLLEVEAKLRMRMPARV